MKQYKYANGFNYEKCCELIDKRNNGTRAMGEEPEEENPVCAYKSVDGNCCGIGVFIPEGHEAQKYEAGVASLIYDRYPEMIGFMPITDVAGLVHFQKVHDGSYENKVFAGKTIRVDLDPRPRLKAWLKENVE